MGQCLCSTEGGCLHRVGLGESAKEEIGLHVQKACLREFSSKGESENGAGTEERCIKNIKKAFYLEWEKSQLVDMVMETIQENMEN